MSRLAARPRWMTLLRVIAPLLLVVLAGCAMVPPTPETKQAKEVFVLYAIVLGMGAVVFVGVEGFILYSIVRYRRRDDRLPTQVHGNNRIELLWTAIPTVIVLVLFVLSTLTLNSIEARSASPGVNVEVNGFQWQWTFHYLDKDADPKNDLSITGTPAAPPVMVVPVGEPIHLILRSNDVIHAFYVPQFLVKRDVIPVGEGRAPNTLEFTISDVGTYAGQCAEFCGDLHSRMTFRVQAMTRADYDAWYAAAKAGGPPVPSVSPTGSALKVTADHISYDVHELTAAAGQPFSIEFTNKEAVSHNVAIYQGEKPFFNGSFITGPGTVSYVVPALPAGTYTFICDVHPVPDMTGTLTIH